MGLRRWTWVKYELQSCSCLTLKALVRFMKEKNSISILSIFPFVRILKDTNINTKQTRVKHVIVSDSSTFLCFTELVWCRATYEIHPLGWLNCTWQDQSSTEKYLNSITYLTQVCQEPLLHTNLIQVVFKHKVVVIIAGCEFHILRKGESECT